MNQSSKKESGMKSVSILAVVVLVAGALLSACVPMTVNAEAQPPLRTINVTGTGEVHLSPDIAYIYLGVHTEDASASAAVAANTTQTQEVIQALQDFGIDSLDIRTTNFRIWPSQNYGPDGLPLDTRYVVDNTVYVTVRDLDRLGELLDVVIGAGVNTVNSIQFDVADKRESLKDARAGAVEDAQARAAELAELAGVELGEIQGISFYDGGSYPIFDGKGGGGGGAAEAAVPIQPGQLTLMVSVSVTYEIK
jgi:uncharacterized protein YggE